MNLCLIIPADDNQSIPHLRDEALYLQFKSNVLKMLENPKIIYFGVAPDNTADGMDELLYDGNQYRIIVPKKLLGINLKSNLLKVVDSFKNVIKKNSPFWSTVIVEDGLVRTETTIEFLYK